MLGSADECAHTVLALVHGKQPPIESPEGSDGGR
jgi:hypothetical protein